MEIGTARPGGRKVVAAVMAVGFLAMGAIAAFPPSTAISVRCAAPLGPGDLRLTPESAGDALRGTADVPSCWAELPPFAPQVRVEATIEAMNPEQPFVCTGSHHEVLEGTAGGKVGGGLFIKAEVSFSVSAAVLTQYDFACDYKMVVHAFGENGFARRVHAAVADPQTGSSKPIGPSCSYAGVPSDEHCETEAEYLRDTFSGAGIAGPLSGGAGLWPLPTAVTICPEPGEETRGLRVSVAPQPSAPQSFLAQAWNDAFQDIPFTGVVDQTQWECQEFGIHYTI